MSWSHKRGVFGGKKKPTDVSFPADRDYFKNLNQEQRRFLWVQFWRKHKSKVAWKEVTAKDGKKVKFCLFMDKYEDPTYYEMRVKRFYLIEKQLPGGWWEQRATYEAMEKATGHAGASYYDSSYHSPREYYNISSPQTLYNLSRHFPEFRKFAMEEDWSQAYKDHEEKREKARKSQSTAAAKRREKKKKAVQFNVPEQQGIARKVIVLYLNKIMEPLGINVKGLRHRRSWSSVSKLEDMLEFNWTGPKKYLFEINSTTVDRTGEKLREAVEDTLGSDYIQDLITSNNDTLRRFAVVFGGDLGALGNIDKDEKVRLAAKVLSEREEEEENEQK